MLSAEVWSETRVSQNIRSFKKGGAFFTQYMKLDRFWMIWLPILVVEDMILENHLLDIFT